MNKPRRIAARGIIFRRGELLVTKFKQDDGSESDYWGTFGGGVDSEESLHDAMHREMIEETGIAPVVGRLLFVQQFTDDERDHLEFFFHIENHEDYEAIDLETTTHGALELTRSAFVNPKTHTILPSFLSEIDIQEYVENDKPVHISTRPGLAGR